MNGAAVSPNVQQQFAATNAPCHLPLRELAIAEPSRPLKPGDTREEGIFDQDFERRLPACAPFNGWNAFGQVSLPELVFPQPRFNIGMKPRGPRGFRPIESNSLGCDATSAQHRFENPPSLKNFSREPAFSPSPFPRGNAQLPICAVVFQKFAVDLAGCTAQRRLPAANRKTPLAHPADDTWAAAHPRRPSACRRRGYEKFFFARITLKSLPERAGM